MSREVGLRASVDYIGSIIRGYRLPNAIEITALCFTEQDQPCSRLEMR
jgi:hypothetical protein